MTSAAHKPSVYQAGPLFTRAEQEFNRHVAEALRAAGHEVFLPQEVEQQSVTGYAQAIFKGDLAGLEGADLVVAILDGPDVDSGTAWECGYAYAKGKKIYGLRTDFRIFGPEEKVNLMVQVPCSALVTTIEALLETLAEA